MATPTSVQETLRKNVQTLKDLTGWSLNEIAKRAGGGVSDKTIGNILNKVYMPGIDKLTCIASAFGLEAYHLLMPDFRPDMIKNGRFDRLYHAYVNADDDGRRVMEATAEYVTKHPTANDPKGGAPEKRSGST